MLAVVEMLAGAKMMMKDWNDTFFVSVDLECGSLGREGWAGQILIWTKFELTMDSPWKLCNKFKMTNFAEFKYV